jgi:siroheme synthase
VIYMGLKNLPLIRKKLLDNGLPADTPVALVHNGTRPDARVVISSLATCVEDRDRAQLKPPTLIIVGNVVRLHASLGERV